MMTGPTAYPTTTTPISSSATQSEALRSKPTIADTPTTPSSKPPMLATPRCSRLPSEVAITTPTSGTAEMSRPASELVIFCSAPASMTHGIPIPPAAKPSKGTPLLNRPRSSPRQTTIGSRIMPDRGAREHQHHRGQVAHRDPDEQVRDAPDHAHREEQQKVPAGHPVTNTRTGRKVPFH